MSSCAGSRPGAHREGVREAIAWLRRTPAAALAMNQAAMNSMRFMLEAAGIEAHGAGGAVKLQGLALAGAGDSRLA